MNRRTLLTQCSILGSALAGCVGGSPANSPTGSPSSPERPTPSPAHPSKPGSVDNARITDVEVGSHRISRSAGDDPTWTVQVDLRLKPADGTPFPIGIFFGFLDAAGDTLDEIYKSVPANRGSTPRQVTVSATYDPDDAAAAAFARYRVDIVHG